jgi:hypothetical protein
MMGQRPTLFKAIIIDSSEVDEVGSALRRTEPERMKGSCGMVTIRERIISRGMTGRSMPSHIQNSEQNGEEGAFAAVLVRKLK